MLSDDELWDKCRNGGRISAQDLNLSDSNGEPFYYTEGTIEKDVINRRKKINRRIGD